VISYVRPSRGKKKEVSPFIKNSWNFFPLSSLVYFFKLSNPSTSRWNAPSVRSVGVAYEKRTQSAPKGEKNAPGTIATPWFSARY
jgi:hypothetical protein